MLDADAARTFRLLGLHPGPDVTVPAAASLTARPSGAVRPLLTALSQAHLVAEHLPGRYVMHDLLRGYAAELAAAEPDEERAAVRRMLDHYLYTADSADRLVDPTQVPPPSLDPVRPGVHPEPMTGRRLALAWFASEHAVLLAVVHCAASSGSDEHTWRLARALESHLGNRGHWQAWLDVAAAGLRAAQRLGDRAAEARMHYSLARVCAVLNRPEAAFDHYQHALERYRGLGDLASTAQVHNGLGGLCQRLGRDDEAFDHNQRAVQLYRRSGHLAGQACALNNVGWLRAAKGDYRQALRDCREALTLLQGTGNRGPEAATWDSLGYIHRRLGEHQEAFACYRRAIDIYRELEDRYNEADSRCSLAEAYRAAGDHNAARQLWQQALDVFDELGHPARRASAAAWICHTHSRPLS